MLSQRDTLVRSALSEPPSSTSPNALSSTEQSVSAMSAFVPAMATSALLIEQCSNSAALPALNKVGGSLIAKVKGKRILLIRNTEESVRGYTPQCSHRAHSLSYDPKRGQILCAEHGSRFDLEGKPLKGPAKKPLAKVYWTKLDRAKQRVIIKLD